MSSTLPAGEHEPEAKNPSTPNVKLADFLKEESVIDGSPLGLDSNPPEEKKSRPSVIFQNVDGLFIL